MDIPARPLVKGHEGTVRLTPGAANSDRKEVVGLAAQRVGLQHMSSSCFPFYVFETLGMYLSRSVGELPLWRVFYRRPIRG
jgi:hypothetical protein